MDIHASMGKKGVGRVSEVEETRTISSRTGRLSAKKNERFEHEELAFIPPQVPSNESAGTQTPQEPDENLVEGESGGEAPETITAVDGLNESRSFASKAARAVERYSFLIQYLSDSFLIYLDKNKRPPKDVKSAIYA